jgi:DNA-binding MarR family transcriptional regulator
VAPVLDFDPIDEARRQWAERWPAAADAMAAATSLMRAQQIVLRAVDGALRPFGLTFARYEALVLLSFTRHGELPLGKMGPRLMIHPTSVTNIVDRLEQDRLVQRVPHPTDRRTTLARITPAGRALVRDATEAVHAVSFGVGALDRPDHVLLTDLVRQMRRAAGDFDDTDGPGTRRRRGPTTQRRRAPEEPGTPRPGGSSTS